MRQGQDRRITCAVNRCQLAATHRVAIIPEGGQARTEGFVKVCEGHVPAIVARATQIMGAVQAGREALVADSYRTEVSPLEPDQAVPGRPPGEGR
jgi:hypothetical protein